MTGGNGYVYVSSLSGHRREYQQLFCDLFDLNPTVGKRIPLGLMSADKVLFATLDDDIIGFSIVSILRRLRGKRTAAIFLRPQSCLGTRVRSRFKYVLMQFLCKMRGVSIISIIPPALSEGIHDVCTDWVHDPQLWDKIVSKNYIDDELQQKILDIAGDRLVLSFLGRGSKIKGLPKLAEFLLGNPSIITKVAILVAGAIDDECLDKVNDLIAAGATVWNYRVNDLELYTLYQNSDLIWANYHPSYDQASGIFGRAVQFHRPVVVREGSLLERYSDMLDHPHIALSENLENSSGIVLGFMETYNSSNSLRLGNKATLTIWRTDFIRLVNRVL